MSYKKSGTYDENFRSVSDASDFFRKRYKVKPVDLKDATNARSLSWNSDGTIIGVGFESRSVFVGSLDAHYCRIRHIYIGYGDGQIEDLEFSHKNPRLFSTCSTDKTVRIWDTSISKTHKRIDTKEQNYFLTFSPDDSYIVVVGKSGNSSTISAIDVRSEIADYKSVLKEEIFKVVFHPSGKYLFLTAENGKLIILEFPSLERYRTIQAHPPLAECLSIAISPDGQTLAIGGSDANCSIWDINAMMPTCMIDRLDYPIRSVSFSKCSNLLAMGSEDAVIDIGWVRGGNEKIIDVPIQNQCYSLAWNPKYYLLAYATASADRERETVRLFGCPGSESSSSSTRRV